MAKPAKTPAYAALLLQQNRRRFFFSTIPIDDLFPYCFVSKREEDPKEGFQRILDPARAEAIAKYLAAGSGSIPSNIVLSAQPEAAFEYTRRTKTVAFQRAKRAFLVLDGQHRLWGYQQCRIRHRVPVAVYQDLSRADEAKLFIDINTNQRGVPAALLLDIKKLAQMESERESTLRDLFDRLKSDSRSPIAGKLSPSKSLSGRISRVTFNRAVGVALDSPIVSDMDSDERYRLVLNYLNAFDAELDSKKLLVRSAFFESMFEIFDEVVRATVTATGNAKQEALQETVRLIAKVNYAGTTSKKSIVNAMQTALRKTVQISGDML